MNKERQKQLLSNFMDEVKSQLLDQADQWPEDWDGFELRWLVEQAILQEAPAHDRMGQKRWRDFKNEWTVKRLY